MERLYRRARVAAFTMRRFFKWLHAYPPKNQIPAIVPALNTISIAKFAQGLTISDWIDAKSQWVKVQTNWPYNPIRASDKTKKRTSPRVPTPKA